MLVKTQIIINPESDKGKTGKRWKDIKEAIRSFIKEFKYEFTEKPLHAIDLTRSAIKEGNELIIGVGGDGTMNEIANGFYEDKKIINPLTSLGIVPSGTGCDLTKSLRIPVRIRDAMKVITQYPSSLIDAGRVTFKNHLGNDEERFFLNVADFGLGGEVVRKVNQKRLERKASSYIRCLLSAIMKYKSKSIKLKIDGQEIAAADYLIGAVANGKIFGKGMKIAPGAKLDDGLFDIVLIRGLRILEFFRHSWKIFLGTHLSHPKISLLRGKTIEAASELGEEVLLELDGEQLGRLPARIEIVPAAIPVKGFL